MDCSMLSAKEKKLSLSGSKKKKKAVIKPVLMPPLAKNFQVQIAEASLCNIFKRNLKSSVENNADKLKSVRSSLTFGVTATYRRLEKGEVAAVLIASDIEPFSLVAHVLRRCNGFEIPVLKLPQLRSLINDELGFSCICIGVIRNCTNFKETISFMCKNDCQTNDSVQVLPAETTCEKEGHKKEAHLKPITEMPFRDFQYLKRTSINERAFMPYKSKKTPEKLSENLDFISISNQDFELDKQLKAGISNTLIRKKPNNKRKAPSENELDRSIDQVKKKSKNDSLIRTGSPMKPEKKVKANNVALVSASVGRVRSNVNRKSKNKLKKIID